MNNSFYQIIILKRLYLKTKKKRPHIRGAGWWGTLFLNQFLKKCNPLSIAQATSVLYTTDSALMIFLYVNLKILKKFCNVRAYA